MMLSRKILISLCLMLASNAIFVEGILHKHRRPSEMAMMLAGGLLTLLFTDAMHKQHGGESYGAVGKIGEHSHGSLGGLGGLSHGLHGGTAARSHGLFGGIGAQRYGLLGRFLGASAPVSPQLLGGHLGVPRYGSAMHLGRHGLGRHFPVSGLRNLHAFGSLRHGHSFRHSANFPRIGSLGLGHSFPRHGLNLPFPHVGKFGPFAGGFELEPINGLNAFRNIPSFESSQMFAGNGLNHLFKELGNEVPIRSFRQSISPLNGEHGLYSEIQSPSLSPEELLHELPRNVQGITVSHSSS